MANRMRRWRSYDRYVRLHFSLEIRSDPQTCRIHFSTEPNFYGLVFLNQNMSLCGFAGIYDAYKQFQGINRTCHGVGRQGGATLSFQFSQKSGALSCLRPSHLQMEYTPFFQHVMCGEFKREPNKITNGNHSSLGELKVFIAPNFSCTAAVIIASTLYRSFLLLQTKICDC